MPEMPDSPGSKLPGLYIHIPFCLTRCPYCDFYSTPARSKIPEFLEALEGEMEMAAPGWQPFDTVYLGGGTPSVLTAAQIERVFAGVQKNFGVVPGAEITLEANPADVSISFLESLKRVGIGRLNIGVQSFDPGVLKFLGRRHSVEEAVAAVESARRAGFADVGLDLIYGVPGQDMASWLRTLSQAVSLSPEHLSCYQLTIEKGTPMARALAEGALELPPEGEQFDLFRVTSEMLEEAGLIHYEVSNFARGERYVSRHNQKYWDHTAYLGLGPGAHSFSGRRRWWNDRTLDRYVAAIRMGEPPPGGAEDLALEDLRMEAFFLGLRTRKGIDVETFSRDYEYDLMEEKGVLLRRFEAEGLIIFQSGRLAPTRTGLAMADTLALI